MATPNTISTSLSIIGNKFILNSPTLSIVNKGIVEYIDSSTFMMQSGLLWIPGADDIQFGFEIINGKFVNQTISAGGIEYNVKMIIVSRRIFADLRDWTLDEFIDYVTIGAVATSNTQFPLQLNVEPSYVINKYFPTLIGFATGYMFFEFDFLIRTLVGQYPCQNCTYFVS